MELTSVISDIKLLDHPFYRRWEAGELIDGELGSYAAQYRFFESQLPVFLTSLTEQVAPSQRKAIEANLADEVDGPVTHLALFDLFAHGVTAPVEPISPAMDALVSLYRRSLDEDPSFALGVLAGYEIQAAEVAMTKGEGLRQHYEVPEAALTFWDVHSHVEEDHAALVSQAASDADPDRVREGVRASAEAWWGFLDEREALVA